MKTTYKNFIISETFAHNKAALWDKNNYNNHIVTIKNTNNGKKTRFDFWCSIVEPDFKNESDLLNAFYCFVSDAVSGLDSFYDFCRNFGYDEDSRRAEKTWKACKKSLEKFIRVSEFSSDEIYDFANELSEIAG